jgi:hypothetical protein
MAEVGHGGGIVASPLGGFLRAETANIFQGGEPLGRTGTVVTPTFVADVVVARDSLFGGDVIQLLLHVQFVAIGPQSYFRPFGAGLVFENGARQLVSIIRRVDVADDQHERLAAPAIAGRIGVIPTGFGKAQADVVPGAVVKRGCGRAGTGKIPQRLIHRCSWVDPLSRRPANWARMNSRCSRNS